MNSYHDRRRMEVLNIIVMIVWSSLMSYVDGSCASKGDIVFLLDESGSIGSSNFERIKSFVSTIVGQFSVGNDTNQFSVVNFESYAREIFPLNRYQTVSSIQSAISSISFSSGGTSIGSALNYARMYSFTTTRGARLDAAKIAVLITDGQSSLSDEPERLKAMGVTIFCVGVGTGVNSAVLRSVATHNDYTYLTTFDLLTLIVEELSNRTCADDINDCLGEPCLNGGTCEDQFGKYVCHCQGGNTDPNCYVPGLPNVTLGSSVLVYSGSTATLYCYVTSLTTVSSIIWLYQKNGVTSVINTSDTTKYSGGTVGTPSLSVKNVQLTDVGNYRCQAQNTAGIGQSESMIYLDLRQGYPNVITTGSYVVNASSNVTLTCNFTSSYPPVQMMKWYKYDSNITTGLTGKYIGGTVENPSLIITDFQLDDQGIYKCSASNSYGTRNSSDIVVYLDGVAPVALTGQNMTGTRGATLIIPCIVVGGSISRVFWTFQPSDQDNETELILSYSKFYWYSYSPSLQIYSLNISDKGFYRCCANSSNGLGKSTPVYVTLRGKQINVDMYTYSVYNGDDVMLSVSIFSMPDAINITWMFSTINYYSYYYYAALDLTSDVRYDGGTVSSPSLVIRNVTASDGGYYILRLTNVDGTIYSSKITLSVQKSLPVITTKQQYFYNVYTESTVSFELNITSKLPVLSVTWEKSVSYFYYTSQVNITDDRIFGGTIDDPSLTITNISLTDTGYYRFTATNADGSRSVVFYLSVSLHPPTTYLSRTSYTIYTGSNVTLDVNVTSTPSLTDIIWERRNTSTYLYSPVDMSDNRFQGGDISAPSLTILDVDVSDGTYYRMQATNRDGTTVSSSIYLYINTRPPVVLVEKTSVTVATRASLSLQVNYTSVPEMKSILWEKGSSYDFVLYVSVNITANSRFTGGTIDSPSLEINDVKPEDSGYYRCRVTNNDGTTTTPVFTVLVQKQLANVNVAATAYTISSGNNATLYVTITNSDSNSTITWERQGQNEASFNVINTQTNVKYGGGTLLSPSLAIYNITDTDVGYYRCKVTNTDGTTTSSLIYIGLKSSDDSGCDKLSCGGLRECVLMNNKPTCSVSTWKAAAVAVAGTVGAAASVAAGVAALKSLTSKAIQPLNGNGNSQGSNSNSNNNRNNNDNNDHNSDNNSDDDNSDRESNHDDDMPDPNYTGGSRGLSTPCLLPGGDISVPSLTILDVDISDGAYYRMQATNRDGTTVSSTIYLNVSTNPPTIYLLRTNYPVFTGSNVTFKVNVTSTPSPTDLFWERRNTTSSLSPIDMSDNRFQGGDISVPSLTILDVDVNDGTNYRMQATNRDGTTVSSTIYLNVSTGPPVVSVGKVLLTVATRASLSLQVNYTSGPEMKSISWEKGSSYDFVLYASVNITANSRFTGGTIDSPTLEINDVKSEDSGYYRCRVTNNDGTTTTPVFTVLVQKQLADINVAASTYTVSSGDNVTLYVTITDSESNSTITWEQQDEKEAGFKVINTQTNVKYEGGTLLSPSLAIYNITDADMGYYRCKVTNTDGTTISSLIYNGLKSYSDDSSCDKLSCGDLRECVLMNNKPTCSVSTWKAAAVAVAGTVGAAASVTALKSLTSKTIQPLNGNGNSQDSNSNSNNWNNRNNNDNNDHNSDNNSDDDNSDRESNHDEDMPDHTFVGGYQWVINSMPPPSI